MTQEEKQLLLKDLCGRLPYGVNIQVYYEEMAGSGYFDETVWVIDNDEPFHVNDWRIENIKPYLRPMSSMTEEEAKEVCRLENFENCIICVIPNNHTYHFTVGDAVIVWLNKHHFDYHGLIEKGLALEAPEGMYKTE